MDNSQSLSFLEVERKHQDMSGGEAFGRMIGGLAICLILILVGVAVLKRFNKYVGVSAERRLKIKERLPISNKTSLVLIELNGKEVLIAVGSDSVTELTGKFTVKEGIAINAEGSVSATLVKDQPTGQESPDASNAAQTCIQPQVGAPDLDTPITLSRTVSEGLDHGPFKSKFLADQLIITNPYRQ